MNGVGINGVEIGGRVAGEREGFGTNHTQPYAFFLRFSFGA